MLVAHLIIPVGQHEQKRQERDPAAEIAQKVQRRMVGPVHVFPDQQHRRVRPADRVQHRAEQLLPVAALQLGAHVRAQHVGHVAHRPQRAGRIQRVTAPGGGAPAARKAVKQFLDEGGLADAGLAADESDSALPPGGCLDHRAQLFEFPFAFYQHPDISPTRPEFPFRPAKTPTLTVDRPHKSSKMGTQRQNIGDSTEASSAQIC